MTVWALHHEGLVRNPFPGGTAGPAAGPAVVRGRGPRPGSAVSVESPQQSGGRRCRVGPLPGGSAAGWVRCGTQARVMMRSAPTRAANLGRAASGRSPPAASLPRITQTGMPDAAGSVRSARPPSQSLLSRRTARTASNWRLDERLRLGLDVPADPVRVRRGDPCRRGRQIRVGDLGWVRGHPRNDRERDRRRIQQDESRRPDPRDAECCGRHGTPAMSDDLHVRRVRAGQPYHRCPERAFVVSV